MKPINRLIVLLLIIAPALASAQGYYGPGPGSPYPSGFHHRMGRLAWGFSVGLGGMSDNGSNVTSCDNCNYNPATIEFDGHIGGMLSPRFALLFEVQANAQTIHSDAENGDTILTQSVAMVAGQYWLTPIFWIKGGIGLANLQSSDGGYFSQDLGNGVGILGAIGVELMSSRFFALDLQGRIIEGSYNGLDDHVTSGTIGLGFNWY